MFGRIRPLKVSGDIETPVANTVKTGTKIFLWLDVFVTWKTSRLSVWKLMN
jgi:hypothetical protein